MCSCHCMLCNRDGRVFNINGVYGNETRTIKEELLNLFGDDVNEYLKDSDVICAVCETLLNWIVKTRNLWFNRMIYHPSCRANPKMRLKPVYYGKIWDAFDMELQKGEEQNNYPRAPSVLSSRGNSPLLVPKRENHYDPVTEEILREKFRNGGIYRPASSCSADREVEETFKRKAGRRKRRKRKNGRVSKGGSSRPVSAKSNDLSESVFEDWEVATQSSLSSLSLANSSLGSVTSSRVVTRSCTRMIMEEVQRQVDLEPQDLLIPCDVKDCDYNKKFETLELLEEHKHVYHKMCYCHQCDECRTQYVSEKDLDRHISLKHDECFNHCLLCGIPMYSRKQLVAHHQQHAVHSVRCLYCDRAFLYKHEYKEHREKHHDSKEKKIRNQRAKKLILEQINYDYEFSISD